MGTAPEKTPNNAHNPEGWHKMSQKCRSSVSQVGQIDAVHQLDPGCRRPRAGQKWITSDGYGLVLAWALGQKRGFADCSAQSACLGGWLMNGVGRKEI